MNEHPIHLFFPEGETSVTGVCVPHIYEPREKHLQFSHVHRGLWLGALFLVSCVTSLQSPDGRPATGHFDRTMRQLLDYRAAVRPSVVLSQSGVSIDLRYETFGAFKRSSKFEVELYRAGKPVGIVTCEHDEELVNQKKAKNYLRHQLHCQGAELTLDLETVSRNAWRGNATLADGPRLSIEGLALRGATRSPAAYRLASDGAWVASVEALPQGRLFVAESLEPTLRDFTVRASMLIGAVSDAFAPNNEDTDPPG